MLGQRRQKERLNALILRSSTERALLEQEVRQVTPFFQKAAGAGLAFVAVKKAAPVLRPVAFGLIQRGLARRNHRFLFKLAGLASFVVGLGMRARRQR